MELLVWPNALPALVILVLLGARRLQLALWLGLVVVLVHSAVAHKEYRFIYPALALFGVLAGLGLAEIVAFCAGRLRSRGLRFRVAGPACAAVAIACWGGLAWHVWTGRNMRFLRSLNHDNLLAASFVAHGPPICGLGLFGHHGIDWTLDGGYTWLDRPVPMYWPKDATELTATAKGFDALIYTQALPPGTDFSTVRCFGRVCVARRPGGCVPEPPSPMPFPKVLEGLQLR